MAQDTQSVPKWFSDFAERNSREHGELRKAIYESGTRTTMAIGSPTRWVISAVAGAVTIILTGVGVATAIIAALINANGI